MEPKLIAIGGKGGVGKTTTAALIVRALLEHDQKPVLVVDADPNSNLNELLGVSEPETLGCVREELADNPRSIPQGMAKHDYLQLRIEQCLIEAQGFDLLVMGRPEGPGCYCFTNNVLRDILKMLAKNYRWIVVDNEAGMEHLSRRITLAIDRFALVSSPTPRGLTAALRIRDLAREMELSVGELTLILNRVTEANGAAPGIKDLISNIGADRVVSIPDDPRIAEFDISGKPLFELPADEGIAYREVRRLVEQWLG